MSSNMVQGGMQGAQIGGQVGGAYGAIIGAVIGVFAGARIDKDQKKVLNAYNKRIQSNVANSLFDLEAQRNVERNRTSQALINYNTQKTTAISNVRSTYGAYDLIGGTTQAVQSTLEFQAAEAIGQEWLNFEVGIRNYNTQVNEIINTGMGMLRGSYNDIFGASSGSGMAGLSGMGQSMGGMSGGFGGGSSGGGGFASSAGSSDFGASSYNFG